MKNLKKENDKNQSNSMQFDRDTWLNNIIKNGKFYFPASTHYVYNITLADVQCDRCHRKKLSACIGYDDRDLCLNCAEIISNSMNLDHLPAIPKPIVDPILPEILRHRPILPLYSPRIPRFDDHYDDHYRLSFTNHKKK